jgi:hypothetical protein
MTIPLELEAQILCYSQSRNGPSAPLRASCTCTTGDPVTARTDGCLNKTRWV